MENRKTEATDVDTGHEYDGIREYDNRLPNWWLWTLIVSVIWGYGYFFYYHVYDRPGLWGDYKTEAAAVAAKSGGPVDDQAILALVAASSEKVGPTYQQLCAVCHGASGEGKIGPNLTDAAWLHGGKPSDIYKTIANGVPSKGMVAWKGALGDEKVKLLAAYVAGNLKGKNVPGKAPEGTPEN